MSVTIGRRAGEYWRRGNYGGGVGAPGAPFASRLIHANYADRGIAIATGVSGWEDVVGNRDFVQADTTKQPAYGVFTTQPAIVFDGVNDFLLSPTIAMSAQTIVTVAMAFRHTGVGSQMIIEASTSAGANPGAFYIFQDTLSTIQLAFKNTAGVPVKNIAAIAAGVHRLIFVMDVTVAATVFPTTYFDGVSLAAGSGTSDRGFADFPLYMGMRGGTTLPWAGKMGDFLMYSGALTAGEIGTVDAFLASRCT